MSRTSLVRHVFAAGLLPAGAVLLLIGLAVGVPVFGMTPPGLALVIAGGLLVAASAMVPPLPSAPKLSSSGAGLVRRRMATGLWLAPILAVLAVVAGAGVSLGVDVTSVGVNTLAEESVAVVGSVGVDVRIVAFVDDERTFAELEPLVERYRRQNPRIRLERRTLRRADDGELARDLGVAEHLALGGPNIVVLANGAPVRLRFDAGLPDQEERLTNALRRATTTSTVKIYVVAGHGEPELVDEGPTGLSRLRKTLSARGLDLVPLPLSRVGFVPDDARGLILLPGAVPLADEEVRVVDAALARGLPLLLCVDPDRPSPRLASWAAAFGVDVVDDVIVDESPFSTMLGGADVASGQGQIGHAITRPLRGALTHFPRAGLLGLAPVEGLDAVPIVSTGPEAVSRKTGARGPLPLVVAIAGADGTSRRTVIAADATFLENAAAGQGANHDLGVNAALWVGAVDDSIVVRPRTRGGSLIFLTPGARTTLTFVVVVLVPGLLLASAAAWAAIRRSR
jgi:hypothetical protein